MKNEIINPKSLFDSRQYGFSQIVISNPGKMVFISITQILKDNFGTINPPASIWLSVKGLANEGFMIEIEAQAVI